MTRTYLQNLSQTHSKVLRLKPKKKHKWHRSWKWRLRYRCYLQDTQWLVSITQRNRVYFASSTVHRSNVGRDTNRLRMHRAIAIPGIAALCIKFIALLALPECVPVFLFLRNRGHRFSLSLSSWF